MIQFNECVTAGTVQSKNSKSGHAYDAIDPHHCWFSNRVITKIADTVHVHILY